jgi:hypothetical protein
MNPLLDEKISQCYKNGMNDYQIADLLHIGRDRLRKWRKKNGILSQSRSKNLKKYYSDILERLGLGQGLEDVADFYGVHRTSISRLIKKEIKDVFNITPDIFKSLSGYEQGKYIESAFKVYRMRGFPYIFLSESKLKKLAYTFKNFVPIIENKTIKQCTIGSNFCEYFFPHIYEASRYDRSSPMSLWNNDDRLKKFIKNRLSYSGLNDISIRRGLKLTGGGVSNFKSSVAKHVYQTYLPDSGITYDFSAGYGSRLLGFLASGKRGKYIGVDPLVNTCSGLRNLYDFWAKNIDQDSSIEINNVCAEDFILSNNSVDLAFSCPPYYDLERYSADETQSYKRYETYKEWLEKFWKPVVTNCYLGLKNNGYFIYVVNNYLNYNLEADMEVICLSNGFIKIDEIKVPLSMMFQKKELNKNFKYERMFIFKKGI